MFDKCYGIFYSIKNIFKESIEEFKKRYEVKDMPTLKELLM